MQRSVSWHDKHTNAGTYTKSLRIDAGREKLVPSYTVALCKYRKILFHLGSTRSLRQCKGRLVHSTLNPRGRTADSHAPRSFRRSQQKVLGYLTPRGNPNIVGNQDGHCGGTQDAKRPSPFCSRQEEGDSRCASNLPSGGIGGTPATMTPRWSGRTAWASCGIGRLVLIPGYMPRKRNHPLHR